MAHHVDPGSQVSGRLRVGRQALQLFWSHGISDPHLHPRGALLKEFSGKTSGAQLWMQQSSKIERQAVAAVNENRNDCGLCAPCAACRELSPGTICNSS